MSKKEWVLLVLKIIAAIATAIAGVLGVAACCNYQL
ncbi:membrane or secreted protein [gut metagenome]|uniref:Membrane or secreted protein n=1 Tax=gut metagenome TaxID=749906 RepID=J9G3S1_9ZZZZ